MNKQTLQIRTAVSGAIAYLASLPPSEIPIVLEQTARTMPLDTVPQCIVYNELFIASENIVAKLRKHGNEG